MTAMADFVASADDVQRLLEKYRLKDVAELLADMRSRGDLRAYLNEAGELCVREEKRPPFYRQLEILGAELDSLCAHHEVERGNLSLLRRRMILEEAWNPEDVAVTSGRLTVFGDTDLFAASRP
jgi:hypothetical protein